MSRNGNSEKSVTCAGPEQPFRCLDCAVCTVKGYLWVQGGYLSVLGGYLDGWVDQVGGQDRWVGRSGGWVCQAAR